jgi:hypothetical protein
MSTGCVSLDEGLITPVQRRKENSSAAQHSQEMTEPPRKSRSPKNTSGTFTVSISALQASTL